MMNSCRSAEDKQQQRGSFACFPKECSSTTEMSKFTKVTETHYLILPDAKSRVESDDWAPAEKEPLGDRSLRSADPILENRDDDSEVSKGGARASPDVDPFAHDDDTSANATGRIMNKSRQSARAKQPTDSDQIAAWRREMSFCITNPVVFQRGCGDSVMSMLDPIDEQTELQQGPMERLVSIGQFFCNPCGGTNEENESGSVDGIISFRQCHSYRTEPTDTLDRYTLADTDLEENDVDEETIVKLLSAENDKSTSVSDDDLTVPSSREGDASTSVKDQTNANETTLLSFIHTFCGDGICGLFSSMRRHDKSGSSSAISLSDMTMPEDGAIFVIRNGTMREVGLGENVTAVDEQLGKETSARNHPGKLVEEKAKQASDDLMHKAEKTKISLSELARAIKTMTSTLSHDAGKENEGEGLKVNKEKDENLAKERQNELTQTAKARLHADMIRDALAEVGSRSTNYVVQSASEDSEDIHEDGDGCFITTRASF